MTHECRNFRHRASLLLSERTDLPESLGCGACEAWILRARAQLRVLAQLGRRSAPPELEARLLAALAKEAASSRAVPLRWDDVLRAGPRRAVPHELAARVALEELQPRLARALRELRRPAAPAVLERLVDEELANPARDRSGRFVGGLRRLDAPAELARSLGRALQGRPVLAGRAWKPLAAAAALLLAWLARPLWLPDEPERPARRSYAFQVVYVDSVGEMSPVARSLAGALTGGLVDSPRREG